MHRGSMIVLALVQLAWAPLSLRAGIVSVVNTGSADPADVYQVVRGGLDNGQLVHVDRAHTFNGVPEALKGLDYVLTANDDKVTAGVAVAATLDGPTRLYLSIDNRIGDNVATNPPTLGAAMGWVVSQGWQSTGWAWAKGGDPNAPYTVYTLVSPGGTHTFYNQDAGDGRNMYSIAGGSVTDAGPFPYASLDLGPNGQRVEPGMAGLAGAPANNVNATNYGPASLERALGRPLDLALDPCDWRDRGNASNAAPALIRTGEDFVKKGTGGVRLTLGKLARGRYTATSYHQDPDNRQSPRIQVYASDAAGAERLLPARGNAYQATTNVNGLTTAVLEASAAHFAFFADGERDVALRFSGTPGVSTNAADTETPVNGLTLQLEPGVAPPALTLFALIDFGPATQRVERGAIALPDAPDNMVNGRSYARHALRSASGVPFELAVDNVAPDGAAVGGIDWRDRGDSTAAGPLVQMGEDHIKSNAGMIRVTLGRLPAGVYAVEGFHHDAGLQQCDDIRMLVTDANGVAVQQALTGDAKLTSRAVNNLTAAGVRTTASAAEFTANGSDDVVLYFDGRHAADREVPLNGLRLEVFGAAPAGTLLLVR